MFKDIELAREENSSYKSLLEESHTSSAIDLNVNVLSASAWPSYPDITLEIPRDIQTAIAGFEKFYKFKHSGRKLTWKHALAHCQLKARYPKGDKEIVVSSFQAIVLLLFNQPRGSENMSYSEIQGATNLGRCPVALLSLVYPDYFR
jgi:cullin-4